MSIFDPGADLFDLAVNGDPNVDLESFDSQPENQRTALVLLLASKGDTDRLKSLGLARVGMKSFASSAINCPFSQAHRGRVGKIARQAGAVSQ